MPGPFPGMDPYLESPSSWQGTHNALIVHVAETLNSILPVPYAATIEMRCFIGRPDSPIRPDVAVRETPLSYAQSRRGNSALADSGDPAFIVRIFPEEIEEAYVDIVNIEDGRHIVTTLEILSHTNKTTRDDGRRLYREKQRKIMASSAHLIEIDLLRVGRHTVACPETVLKPAHEYDYLICLHRAGRGLEFEVWMNSLRDRLPRIAVPLDKDVDDVILDLQAVLNHTYDAGAYTRIVDYSREAAPPLSPDDLAWADQLLKDHGLRS